MTVNLALEYVAQRMSELCYGNNYHVRFRHLVLQPVEVRTIAAHGQFFLLLEPTGDVRIESDAGLYDQSENNTNELQHEHQGSITISNLSHLYAHLQFIQVIPQ